MFEHAHRIARRVFLGAAAFAACVAAVILWLGYRHDAGVDRIIAEGRLAEGAFLGESTETCTRGSSSSCYRRVDVAYAVNGTRYETSMTVRGSGPEPIFEQEVIRVPRLGDERPWQVVYLPSDPSVARMRADLQKSDVAVYGTAGFFSVIAFVFGAVGIFAFRKRPIGG
jgi:hypothetical protein